MLYLYHHNYGCEQVLKRTLSKHFTMVTKIIKNSNLYVGQQQPRWTNPVSLGQTVNFVQSVMDISWNEDKTPAVSALCAYTSSVVWNQYCVNGLRMKPWSIKKCIFTVWLLYYIVISTCMEAHTFGMRSSLSVN